MPAPAAGASSRRARLALALWILAFPAFTLWRARGGRTEEPAPPEPAWAHVVVLTVAEWPAGTAAPEGPGFASLLERGVRLGPLFTPSTSSAAAAASLWTGRWPASHGVVDADRALAPGAWTLASAAQASGAVTAAFLEEPFSTVTRLHGFDLEVEDPEIDDAYLLEQAERFLREHRDERTLLWIHLAGAGPRGARLEGILRGVQQAQAAVGIAGSRPEDEPAAAEEGSPTRAGLAAAALDRRAETLTIVTALRAAPSGASTASSGEAASSGAAIPGAAISGADAAPAGPDAESASGTFAGLDAPFLVPLFVELPTGLNAGTAAYPHLALVDVAGFAARLLRLEPGDAHPQSRPNAFALALAGGAPVRPVELAPASPSPGGPTRIFRDGARRAAFAGETLLAADELPEGFLAPASHPLAPDASAALAAEAAAFHAALEAQATPARAAKRTPSWQAWR